MKLTWARLVAWAQLDLGRLQAVVVAQRVHQEVLKVFCKTDHLEITGAC